MKLNPFVLGASWLLLAWAQKAHCCIAISCRTVTYRVTSHHTGAKCWFWSKFLFSILILSVNVLGFTYLVKLVLIFKISNFHKKLHDWHFPHGQILFSAESWAKEAEDKETAKVRIFLIFLWLIVHHLCQMIFPDGNLCEHTYCDVLTWEYWRASNKGE